MWKHLPYELSKEGKKHHQINDVDQEDRAICPTSVYCGTIGHRNAAVAFRLT